MLGRLFFHQPSQPVRLLGDVDFLQQRLDRLGADRHREGVAVFFLGFLELLLGQELLFLQSRFSGIENDIGFEIQDFFQILDRQVQDEADPARRTFKKPDVRDRRGQLDVAHALAAHFGLRHLDAASFADDAPVLHSLVFSAEAFEIVDRPESFRAEQPVLFRLEGPVVDGFRLGHFPPGPAFDLFR